MGKCQKKNRDKNFAFNFNCEVVSINFLLMYLEIWKINIKTAVDGHYFSLFQLFIRELVRNLFNEGNDVYREGDWRGSLSHYTEAINIADYANSEEIHVSDDILEKLHVNRIACFSNMVSFCFNCMISQVQCADSVKTQNVS